MKRLALLLVLGLAACDKKSEEADKTAANDKKAPEAKAEEFRDWAVRGVWVVMFLLGFTALELEKQFQIAGSATRLVEGENLLAIHGLNRGATSGDMLIAAEMRASRDGTVPEGPKTLNDLNFGFDGPYHRFSFDIPDDVLAQAEQ